MLFNKYLRWALAPALLVAAPAFASTAVVACFGSGTITTNPQMSCPDGSTPTPLLALSLGGSDAVNFMKKGVVSTSHLSLSSVTVEQKQGAATDLLLQDLYAGKSVGPVVIALYQGSSSTPSYSILLTNAFVNSWQVSGSEGGGGVVEAVSLSFVTISILDVATNQTVSWNVVTNTP
jgi:type VI protein secretion system component Hcp